MRSCMMSSCVDDLLSAGNKEFMKNVEKPRQKFQCWNCSAGGLNGTISNMLASNVKPWGLAINRFTFEKLAMLSQDCSWQDYRTLRQKIRWLSKQSRPDVSCAAAKAAQVTEDLFKADANGHRKVINKIVQHLHQHPETVFQFPKLDKDSLHLRVFADASFAENVDNTSQLGCFVFMADKSDQCTPLVWSSYKAKRVTRSVLGAETLALADGFDAAYSLQHHVGHDDLQRLVSGQTVPVSIFTDSMSLFNIVTRHTIPTEKWLSIDIDAIRQSYKTGEIEMIGFIRTDQNPADALTKTHCDESSPPDNWVYKSNNGSPTADDFKVSRGVNTNGLYC